MAVPTEYLSNEIYKRATFKSVFDTVVPRGVYARGTGITHTTFTVQNSAPTTTTADWDAVTLANGSNAGACATSFNQVNVGYTARNYSPVKRDYMGPLWCRDDFEYDHNADQFVDAYITQLANYVRLDWEYQLQRRYARFVPIYVAGASFYTPTAANSTLTAPQSQSELTTEMLEGLAAQLIYNRATDPDTFGFVSYTGNGPTFSLSIGLEMNQKIVRNNAEYRQDYRWADPGVFMQGIGATKVIGNFRYLSVDLPMRFIYDGTKYVEVPRWADEASTKGTPQNINPNWLNPAYAKYEAAFVLNPNVMIAEIVTPSATVGGLRFDPYGYQGEWKWVTGRDAIGTTSSDACFDPLHLQGRHFGRMIYAPKPGSNPQAGAIIIFKRCAETYTLSTCS